MASTDARPLPRKNIAYRVTFPIFDADGDLVSGATGLDSEVSIDGGTFADCTNEATEIAASSGMYFLDLTAGEMNGDTVSVIVKTSSVGAKTTPIVMYPEELGDIRCDVGQISGDATAADNAEAFFDGTGYAGTGNVIPTVTTVTTVSALAADSITSSAFAASAATEIADAVWDALRSGHTTAGSFGEGVVVNSTASTERDELAKALLKLDWTGITGEAARSTLMALRFLRNKWDVTSGTLTVKKENDSTTAWTAAITSNASAAPIIGSDPA